MEGDPKPGGPTATWENPKGAGSRLLALDGLSSNSCGEQAIEWKIFFSVLLYTCLFNKNIKGKSVSIEPFPVDSSESLIPKLQNENTSKMCDF